MNATTDRRTWEQLTDSEKVSVKAQLQSWTETSLEMHEFWQDECGVWSASLSSATVNWLRLRSGVKY